MGEVSRPESSLARIYIYDVAVFSGHVRDGQCVYAMRISREATRARVLRKLGILGKAVATEYAGIAAYVNERTILTYPPWAGYPVAHQRSKSGYRSTSNILSSHLDLAMTPTSGTCVIRSVEKGVYGRTPICGGEYKLEDTAKSVKYIQRSHGRRRSGSSSPRVYRA